jgi:hypothetical protein
MFSKYFEVIAVSFIGLEHTGTSTAEECGDRRAAEFFSITY